MSWRIIEHEGRRHRVAVCEVKGDWWLGFEGGSVKRAKKRAGVAGQAEARPEDIIAPLTAKVIAVEVVVGDAVSAEQQLVVLEAMKMEYRITAPRDGDVASVNCGVGDLVEQGTVLVALEEVGE